MIEQPTVPAISASVIPDNRRMAFLPLLFGAWFATAENAIYRKAEHHIDGYSGGEWDFMELTIGGGYLVWKGAERVLFSVPGNGFEGEMSADAAGIVLTIFTLNHLAWHAYERECQHVCDKLITQQERLKMYADQHPEAGLIFRAID